MSTLTVAAGYCRDSDEDRASASMRRLILELAVVEHGLRSLAALDAIGATSSLEASRQRLRTRECCILQALQRRGVVFGALAIREGADGLDGWGAETSTPSF